MKQTFLYSIVMSRCVLSNPVLSYNVLSFPVLSCPVLSCLVLFCPVLFLLSYPVLIPYPAVFCPDTSIFTVPPPPITHTELSLKTIFTTSKDTANSSGALSSFLRSMILCSIRKGGGEFIPCKRWSRGMVCGGSDGSDGCGWDGLHGCHIQKCIYYG